MSANINDFRDSYFRNNFLDERNNFNVKRFELMSNNEQSTSEDPGVKGIPMVFITTPHLNLQGGNIGRDDFLYELSNRDSGLINALSNTSGRPFIHLLSNRMSEFTISDLTTQTKETHETHYGYVQNLPLYAPTADTTNITYVDNSNLDVLKMHKAWFDYTINVTRGILSPTASAISNRFIDYTSSIYHFILDMDGETIQYFDKFTGCYPTTVPYSEFSSKVGNNQELIEYSIEYSFSYREYMNSSILVDFNNLSRDAHSGSEAEYIANNDRYSNRTINDFDYNTIDQTSLRHPRVVSEGNKYKLRFV